MTDATPAPHDLGADICRALRGSRISSFAWLTPCPLKHRHRRRKGSGGASLRITIAGSGLDVECANGCDQADLRTWLERRGFLHGDAPVEHIADAEALAIWNDAKPIAGTHGHAFFRAIGLSGPLPPSLRFRPAGAVRLPQVVAGIQAPDGRVIAVQLLLLDRERPQLATPPTPQRIVLGALGRGAFRATPPRPNIHFVETVEESIRLTKGGEPAWAALAGWRIGRVEIADASARRAA